MAKIVVLGAGLGGIIMAYEMKYFLHKIRHGQSETFYENLVHDVLGIKKLKDIHLEPAE